MPIPEDTLMAMEKAARQIKPGPWCRPYYGSKDSQDFLALIAAYRKQGRELAEAARELETMDQVIEINNRLHAELTEAKRKADLWDKEGWRDLDVLREALAAAREAASARIDEIAALTEERDQARVERDALQMTAEEQSEVFGERFAALTALLNKAALKTERRTDAPDAK